MNIQQPNGAPIGIFDSGVGGLSVLKAIHAMLPNEHLIYVADAAYAPYGDKAPRDILARSKFIVDYLVQRKVKAIVIACNTASAIAAKELRQAVDIPIIAIEPAIKPAIAGSSNKVIGVLATKNTIASAAFAGLCDKYANGAKLIVQACPGLVEQIEVGQFSSPTTVALLREYLTPIMAAKADTLVLGCTHYPFLIKQIQEIIGTGVEIIEPSHAVARELTNRLNLTSAPRSLPATAEIKFLSTGKLDIANHVFTALWGRVLQVEALAFT
jgi:glutamate racemase